MLHIRGLDTQHSGVNPLQRDLQDFEEVESICRVIARQIPVTLGVEGGRRQLSCETTATQ